MRELTTQEFLEKRRELPTYAPLSSQIELAWLESDDESFSQVNELMTYLSDAKVQRPLE